MLVSGSIEIFRTILLFRETYLFCLVFPNYYSFCRQKALAATGDKGVQLASDWLLSHVHDPLLDDDSPREYIVYLCPVGELQKQLLDMWRKSKLCGWMGSHNFFPHVTLCSFFKAENCQVAKLHAALRIAAESLSKDIAEIKLDYFSSCNFIGLFIDDKPSIGLRQVMSVFEKKAVSFGVQVKKKKDLHLSLAYNFLVINLFIIKNFSKKEQESYFIIILFFFKSIFT